jgi:hypothetical protein
LTHIANYNNNFLQILKVTVSDVKNFAMNDTKRACEFLEHLARADLALLLAECNYKLEVRTDSGFWSGDESVHLILFAPQLIASAVSSLPDHDKKRLSEALSVNLKVGHTSFEIVTQEDKVPSTSSVLLAELTIQRETMISVATGQKQIQEINDYYIAREMRLRNMMGPNSVYQNPFSDLWEWYHFWKQNLSSYSERRNHVKKLFEKSISVATGNKTFNTLERALTGWERVDRTILKANSQLALSSNEEEYQAVGLLCREAIISLAQAVYKPDVHMTVDGVLPSSTDANRMLEAFISIAMPGGSEKEVRSHARASLALALNLQHRRTANRRLAALCLEATSSTVAVVKIIDQTQ